jgi:hypothetical protein
LTEFYKPTLNNFPQNDTVVKTPGLSSSGLME